MNGEKLNTGAENNASNANNPNLESDPEQEGLNLLDRIIMEPIEVGPEDGLAEAGQARIRYLDTQKIISENALEATLNSIQSCEGQMNLTLGRHALSDRFFQRLLSSEELLEAAAAHLERGADPTTSPSEASKQFTELSLKLIELYGQKRGYEKKIQELGLAIESIKRELENKTD